MINMGPALSVVVIGPDQARRRAMTSAFTGAQSQVSREFTSYPPVDDLSQLFEADHDVVLVDLDPDPEKALDVIETLCGADSALTVIVYSARTEPELLVRCMRAGAREFLKDPVLPGVVADALVRASVRRDEVSRARKPLGKLLVFAGAKGGSGCTTVAANVAVSLAKDSGASVALLDLDLQLGDAALSLGVSAKFSTSDALENISRLDSDFLTAMMAKHISGLSVLAAPDAVSNVRVSAAGLDRLLRVACENFSYVVVDAGGQFGDASDSLFAAATSIYLVTQVAIPELRNANRLISRYFTGVNGKKLEIVLNRFAARGSEIDDDAISKALNRPANWKVPNDFPAARAGEDSGVPMVMGDSAPARCIRDMARAAAGQPPLGAKKKRFSLF